MAKYPWTRSIAISHSEIKFTRLGDQLLSLSSFSSLRSSSEQFLLLCQTCSKFTLSTIRELLVWSLQFGWLFYFGQNFELYHHFLAISMKGCINPALLFYMTIDFAVLTMISGNGICLLSLCYVILPLVQVEGQTNPTHILYL